MNIIVAALVFLLAGLALQAQTRSGDSTWRDLERSPLTLAHPGSQLKDHIYERSRRFFAAGDAARDALRSPAEVRGRQEEVRRGIIEGLGGLPAMDTPLNARLTGVVQGDGFTIEKIIFEARPRHYVTANLYLPANRPPGRSGAVLFLSGHHATAKQAPEYQDVCQTLVRAGLIVFSVDPIGQGERWSYWDATAQTAAVVAGTREHDQAGTQLRFIGEALGRYFVHDAMRSIDYLLSRAEVDPAKIGVTGNSGGGTQTALVMMADPRVAAAAPATFLMSRETYQRTGQAQDAEQIWPGFTSRGFDHEDVLLAMAPKPVCVLAVKWDFFPIEGTRRTVSRARRAWELFPGAPAPELVEDDSIHSYTPRLAVAAARFFARHLLGREVDLTGFKPKAFPHEVLNCTKSGQVRGELADAEFVFETATKKRMEVEQARAALTPLARQRQAIEWLRAAVNNGRENSPLNPRRTNRGAMTVGSLSVEVAFWYSQPYLANLGMLFRPHTRASRPLPVTIAIWDDGTAALSRHSAWIQAECDRGRAVFVVNLAGVGPLAPDMINAAPDRSGTFRKLTDDLDWMGDSLVGLRTFEAVRAIEALAAWPDLAADDIRFYGSGKMGVHARLAAALTPRAKGSEWVDGFAFSDFLRTRVAPTAEVKPYSLPGVLRVFDVNDL
ncbi:MAG: hypothetical protein RIQ93_3075 [Verrucomicrobiota bacterium]|jgi:cephalosporin-C deacetylase-like acetyl esterase